MAAFYQKSYWCNTCSKPFNCSFGKHKCNYKIVCFASKNRYCVLTTQIQCINCYTQCQNQWCLYRHTKICNGNKKCSKCNAYKTWNHVCNNEKCSFYCKTSVDFNNKCYIPKKLNSEEKKLDSFIFFDFESMNVNKHHVANLVIAEKVCKNCLDFQIRDCTKCENFHFYSNDDFLNGYLNKKTQSL